MTEHETLIQAMFDACTSCCADVAADEACTRCQLMARAANRLAATKFDYDDVKRRYNRLLEASRRHGTVPCEEHDWQFIFSTGEDAPGRSLDTIDRCALCGTIRHDYRHGGGHVSPNYPQYYASPLIGKLEAECTRRINAEMTRDEARKAIADAAPWLGFDSLATIVLTEHPENLPLAARRRAEELHRWQARFAEAVIDGDRMRATLHDLAFAAPIAGDEHRNAKGWLSPEAWSAYVSRVQKMAGGAIRRPLTDSDAEGRVSIVDHRANVETDLERAARLAAKEPRCPQCGRQSRDETVGCDHCDLEDK